MPRRIESPSSINTYKQCPRKYFYQYIRKLPTFPNIHTVRGNIVHSALEKFFDIDPASLDPLKYMPELAAFLSNLFDACWRKKANELEKVTCSEEQERKFYDESKMMLGNWLNAFFDDLKLKMHEKSFIDAFNEVKPTEMEEKYESKEYSVRGYIDAVSKIDGITTLIDYKTSKPKDRMPPDYRLQLAIYALMYKEKHGMIPDRVGVWFLKSKEMTITADEELVQEAKFEIEQIHASTESDMITDYKCTITPLCKWSTGQCNFYETCIKDRSI
ncbi:RecB family exonuclease [Thermoproteota archaeon]